MPSSHDLTRRCRQGVRPFGYALYAIGFVAFFLCLSDLNVLSSRLQSQEMPLLDTDGDNEDEPDVGFNFRGALPRMTRQQIEEYMYGSLGGSKANFHKARRENIRRELDRIDSICTLSVGQWSKLKEAIELDIQHMENGITSLLSGYDAKISPQRLQEMQQQVWQYASSVQSSDRAKNAVWSKVLNTQLTKVQLEMVKSDENKKIANEARTMRFKHLLSLQRKLGLNAIQRSKIDEWLKLEGRSELDFLLVCEQISQSPSIAELLSQVQLQSIGKPAPANALPLPRVLPNAKDLFK